MATPARSVLVRAAVAAALVLATTSWTGAPASAAPPVGVSAAWTYDTTSRTGTVALPGVSGFPTAVLATNGGGGSVPAGGSAYLGPATPYGAAFGSTRDLPYFTVAANGSAPSTTTITFPSAVQPGGWGFALGDVDADRVQVLATGPGGTPLTSADLGFQGTFNSCGATPVPSGCSGPPYVDVPTWDAATAILSGSGSNTSGATGWFRPTSPVTSLTLVFSIQTGIPNYQLWISGLEASAGGTVGIDDPAAPPPTGTEVALETPGGDPVPDPDGDPVVEVVEADGAFTLSEVLVGEYVAVVTPPPGVDAAVVEVPIDLRDGDVEDLAVTLVPNQATTTTTSSTTSTTSSTSTSTTSTTPAIDPPTPAVAAPADAVPGRPTYTG